MVWPCARWLSQATLPRLISFGMLCVDSPLAGRKPSLTGAERQTPIGGAHAITQGHMTKLRRPLRSHTQTFQLFEEGFVRMNASSPRNDHLSQASLQELSCASPLFACTKMPTFLRCSLGMMLSTINKRALVSLALPISASALNR